MRRLALGLLATAALSAAFTHLASAADMPVKAAPTAAIVAPVYDWSGLYLGVNAGGGWGTGNFCTDAFTGGGSCAAGDVNSPRLSGGLAGLQLGWRWQTNNLVLGIEGMYDWARIRGDQPSPLVAATNRVRGEKIKSLYSITGSLGWAWNSMLVYGKAGWAGARADLNADNLNAGGFNLGSSTTLNGYTLGLGIETKIWTNWSLGLEYDYYRLTAGDINNVLNTGGALIPCAFCSISSNVHTVVGRLNYTFNWPTAVVAKN